MSRKLQKREPKTPHIGDNFMQHLTFIIFSTLALLSGLFVILAKNPIRAVLGLIMTFLSTSITWLILDAEFLGITLVLVYVGAVMILFMFVVMMLDIKFATINAKFSRWLPLGIILTMAFITILLITLSKSELVQQPELNTLAYAANVSNTKLLGNLVFTEYLLQFELAGVLLLVAIIAAIGLIYRGPQARKIQNIKQQIAVKPKDRVRLVDGI